MKYCKTCDTTKARLEFGKRKASKDGLAPLCKSCLRAYDKSRLKCPKRAAHRAAYQKSDKGRPKADAAKREWRNRNPSKAKAMAKISYNIRIGALTRQPCEKCKTTNNVHAHHDDYSKPLDVRWLCAQHHRDWHAKHGEALNP